MDASIRPYDPVADFADVTRIWREVRWIDDDEAERVGLQQFLETCTAEVGTLDGSAECLVAARSGSITYDRAELDLAAVAAVTTSSVGRRQQFASRLTVRALAREAAAGAAVAALGAFEHGFYDRFGFATASYDHQISFDPQSLRIDQRDRRVPVRLGVDDAVDMAAALGRRLDHHGRVSFPESSWMAAEFAFVEHPLALGFRNVDGRLTHFLLGSLKEEHGPLDIEVFSAETIDQYLELLGLLRELSDQVRSVTMFEPPMLPMSTMIDQPMRQRDRSRRSAMESGTKAFAWCQLRILDLRACVAARRWHGAPIRFDLTLTDPVADFLPGHEEPAGGSDARQPAWSGIGGDYTVEVGPTSTVEPGHANGVPLVRCSVGAFTRMWFGVAPASALHASDDFDAPSDLTARLDDAFRLPATVPGMMF